MWNATLFDGNYNWNNFSRRNKMGSDFNLQSTWFILILGQCSIILNMFVIFVILANRKVVLKNVFYMLVLHCAMVDLLRASALTAWCLPSLNIFSFQTVIQMTNAKKWIVLFLQSFNLLTILNLLIFTINEYIVVIRPLQYRQMNRSRLACIFIAFSWILSIGFAVGYALTRNYVPMSNTVYISSRPPGANNTMSNLNNNLTPEYQYYDANADGFSSRELISTDPDNGVIAPPVITFVANLNTSAANLGRNSRIPITRGTQAFDESQYSFSFAIIAICMFCVVTVITCYIIILIQIKNFKNCTELKVASKNYKKIRGGIVVTNNAATAAAGAANGAGSAVAGIGGRRLSGASATKTSGQKRMEALKRHKYVLVIGSVLAVDVLFLIPYSTIRILQYINISGLAGLTARPRIIMQFIIVVHMVLQPLCYFRMGEFRRMAKCRRTKTARETSNNKRITMIRQSVDVDNFCVEHETDTTTTARKAPNDTDSMKSCPANNESVSLFRKKLAKKYYFSVESNDFQ